MAVVLSLHRGAAEPVRGRPDKVSAIRKVPLTGPVVITVDGVEGDRQIDRRYHGGPYKALCAYASEYYGDWNAQAPVPMPPGSFGENLHTAGLLDPDVHIGDVRRLGTALIEVTGPRGPCGTLAAHWGLKDINVDSKRLRRTGYYLRVLEPGMAEAGDVLLPVDRTLEAWPITRFWDLLDAPKDFADLDAVRQLRNAPALDEEWHARLDKIIARSSS